MNIARSIPSCLVALFLVAGPLAAQSGARDPAEVPADDSDGIIVQAERQLERSEVISTVRDIVMRGRTTDRPLTKFQDAICLHVSGLGDRAGAATVERITAPYAASASPLNVMRCISRAWP